MILLFWLGFVILILILLAIDLGVFHKKAHVIKTKEAFLWTCSWIFLSLIFNIFIYYSYENHWLGMGLNPTHTTSGSDAALKYLTGYIIEKSLSLDNIFVIAMIFTYFNVPLMYQHRVLFWGILGALIMRFIMILAGTALIQSFNWMTYVFGFFLILTSIKMLFTKEEKLEPEKNLLIRLFRKIYPVTPHYQEAKFFAYIDHRRAITPLFLVLLVIESTDVMFAVDSIPAIFAITTDPYLIFTSNVFAILGLRSLYFVLAAIMDKFRYLKVSLVIVLSYVGIKMILAHHYPIPTSISLGIIAVILTAGVVVSIFTPQSK